MTYTLNTGGAGTVKCADPAYVLDSIVHFQYGDTPHCSEMRCSNYISRCPEAQPCSHTKGSDLIAVRFTADEHEYLKETLSDTLQALSEQIGELQQDELHDCPPIVEEWEAVKGMYLKFRDSMPITNDAEAHKYIDAVVERQEKS